MSPLSFNRMTFPFDDISSSSAPWEDPGRNAASAPIQLTPAQVEGCVYFKKVSEIFHQAVGEDNSRRYKLVSHPAVTFEPDPEDRHELVTPFRLSMKINLLVIRAQHFCATGRARAASAEAKQLAVIFILTELGFTAKALQLQPPTNAAGALGNHVFYRLGPPRGVELCPVPPRSATASRASPSAALDEQTFVLDFGFAEMFAIARPTPAYE
eukprot:RCo012794